MSLIKTQLQSRNILKNEKPSIRSTIKRIFKHEGITGFYKGFSISLLGLISGPVYVTTFEISRENIRNTIHNIIPTYSQPISATCGGLIATSFAQMIQTPIDIISQKRMVNKYIDKIELNSMDIIRNIIKEDGLKGLYRGLSLSIFTYAPTSALVWGSYYYLKNKCSKMYINKLNINNNNNSILYKQYSIYFICGGFSGCCSSFITMPIDTIRTRKQVLGNFNTKSIDIIKTVYNNDGIPGFFRGVSARMWSGLISASLLITAYEFVKHASKN